MLRYLSRRFLGAIFVMWVVAMLVFFMMRIVPGDPFEAMLFDSGDPAAAEELRKKFGLDQPAHIQYLIWQWNTLHGEFGFSIYGSHQPVSRLIAEALPRTLSLAGLSFFLAVLIAVPAGIIANGILLPLIPEETSCTVPSPPQATITFISDLLLNEYAISEACPTLSVIYNSVFPQHQCQDNE